MHLIRLAAQAGGREHRSVNLTRQTLPDAAGIDGVHGLAFFAAEGFAELVKVLHDAVDAPAVLRMRIGERQLAREGLGLIGAPDLRKTDEEALRFSVAVDFV